MLLPLPHRVEAAWRTRLARPRGRERPLAEPPAGSGWSPVPGDAGLPVLGHVVDYVRFGSDFTRARRARYGPVSWMSVAGTPMVLVAGPGAALAVLTDPGHAYSQEAWRERMEQFFRGGLMLLDGNEHRAHRRTMQEVFTPARVAGYAEAVGRQAHTVVGTWPVPARVRIYPRLKALTLGVATRVFMGVEDPAESEELGEAFLACVRASNAVVRRPLPGTMWRAGLRGRAHLERWFAEAVPAARGAPARDDLLAVLCRARTEDGEAFDDEDVVNHMIFLMMAAHDTSTIATTAVVHHLAVHPGWQEQVRTESDALRVRLGGRPPVASELAGLTELRSVVRESLRLVPPVPMVARTAVRDTAILGRFVPAGTRLTVAGAVNHFDEAYWTEPDRFDPTRFDEPRREDRNHRAAWSPFGHGMHKCLGWQFGLLEITAVMHELLGHCAWSVPEGYRLRWDNTSLPIPSDGLPVDLRARSAPTAVRAGGPDERSAG